MDMVKILCKGDEEEYSALFDTNSGTRIRKGLERNRGICVQLSRVIVNDEDYNQDDDDKKSRHDNDHDQPFKSDSRLTVSMKVQIVSTRSDHKNDNTTKSFPATTHAGRMIKFLYPSILCLILLSSTLVQDTHAKEIDSKTDLQQEESEHQQHRSYHAYPGHLLSSASSTASIASSSGPGTSSNTADPWPQSRGDMPQIKGLNVKCEKNYMKVNIEFDRPFYGMVFSKGHYNDPKCVHMSPNSGNLVSNFDIFMNACGMTSSEGTSNRGSGYTSAESNGLFIENTIIIQYDGQVQEIYDQARRLRCTWYDYYEKAVTFKPFNVEMQDAVTANFLGDNIQCWMQIQAGKGPWASEVAGIVKIGQTMTMVLAIKDDENKFDMLVRNCVAHDGKHAPIQLVDENGCVIRPKIMSKFQKIKNFGHSATVVSYAYFQAFKFPDSMNVHFQCVIQVCRHECPEPACDSSGESYSPPRGTVVSGSSERDGELTSGTRTVGVGTRASSSSNRFPIYRPAPTSYSSFSRRSGHLINSSSEAESKKLVKDTGIIGLGASPRGMPVKDRSRRHITSDVSGERDDNSDGDDDQEESTEVKTSEKIIQVVAPGDVAFNLATIDTSSNENELWNKTSIEDLIKSRSASYDDIEYLNSICISSRSFISGLVILFSLLIISCLITAFLYVRLRSMSNLDCHSYYKDGTASISAYLDTSLVGNGPCSLINQGIVTFENPEFLHHPSLTSYH